jgi:hypothetical protein
MEFCVFSKSAGISLHGAHEFRSICSFRAHFVNQILAANAGSKIFSKSLGFAGFEPW